MLETWITEAPFKVIWSAGSGLTLIWLIVAKFRGEFTLVDGHPVEGFVLLLLAALWPISIPLSILHRIVNEKVLRPCGLKPVAPLTYYYFFPHTADEDDKMGRTYLSLD